MADCLHRKTHETPSGSYCVDCGLRMVAPPPPIYYDHVADAKAHNWRSLTDWHGVVIEPYKTYIGALYLEDARAWALVRVQWCVECGHLEVAQGLDEHHRCHAPAPVTHLSDDVLGTPRLSSTSGSAS